MENEIKDFMENTEKYRGSWVRYHSQIGAIRVDKINKRKGLFTGRTVGGHCPTNGTDSGWYPTNTGFALIEASPRLAKKMAKVPPKIEELFILWKPGSPYPPTKRFESKEEAEVVAEKMTASLGGEMYVMKAVSRVQKKEVVTFEWSK